MKKILYLIISVNILLSCKSAINNDFNKEKKTLELKITDYSFGYDNGVNFQLELINNTNQSIYILKPSDETYASPEFFKVNTTPTFEQCEIRETKNKPISHIIEVRSNSKHKLEYKQAFFGTCEDFSGESIEFQIVYHCDISKSEYLNYINNIYDNKKDVLDEYKKLSILSLKSNTIKVKIPE